MQQLSKIGVGILFVYGDPTSNGQLDQIIKQLRKLEDVRTVCCHQVHHQIFVKL